MTALERPTAPTGRPRRYDDDTERQLLIDAAFRVMEQSPDGSISVGDVLDEASLTTRAFYRHFGSKNALAETLLLRDVEVIGRTLARRVAAAPNPVAAVEAWVDHFIDVIFDPKKVRRASRIRHVADDRDRGPSARMLQEMRALACASLIQVLGVGNASGALRSPTPEADAFSMYELVLQVREAGVSTGSPATREQARAHVARFAYPALGLA
jgi:AcrR family transcriptional regulator